MLFEKPYRGHTSAVALELRFQQPSIRVMSLQLSYSRLSCLDGSVRLFTVQNRQLPSLLSLAPTFNPVFLLYNPNPWTHRDKTGGTYPPRCAPFFCLGEFGTKVKNDRMPKGSQNAPKRSRNARTAEPIAETFAGTTSRFRSQIRDESFGPERRIG